MSKKVWVKLLIIKYLWLIFNYSKRLLVNPSSLTRETTFPVCLLFSMWFLHSALLIRKKQTHSAVNYLNIHYMENCKLKLSIVTVEWRSLLTHWRVMSILKLLIYQMTFLENGSLPVLSNQAVVGIYGTMTALTGDK